MNLSKPVQPSYPVRFHATLRILLAEPVDCIQMTAEIKQRLFITAIVVAMASLYVGTTGAVFSYFDTRGTLLAECRAGDGFKSRDFEFCWDEINRKVGFPLWLFLAPFIPAAVALWLNWLFKIDMRLAENVFPRRTISLLLWLGLCGAAWAVYVDLEQVAAADKPVFNQTLSVPLIWAAGFLAAPMLFHYLLAPATFSAQLRNGKIALVILAATPVMLFVAYLVSSLLRDGL
jgi:hypothetical protein